MGKQGRARDTALRDTRVGDEEVVLPPFGETVETVCPVNEQLWGTLVLEFDFFINRLMPLCWRAELKSMRSRAN